MRDALPYIVGIVVMLSYVAMQGLIVFVTAYLLKKSVRKKVALSKGRATLLSYCFWVFVMMAGNLFSAGNTDLLGWGGLVLGCLTALASAGLYLWLWQKHDPSVTRKML